MSSIAGDARSVVRLTLRRADGSENDLEVEGAASATAGEIAAALAFHTGTPARNGLHCLRLGPLPAELPLHRSGLRDGDVVALDPLERGAGDTLSGSGAPVAELVVGGPAAGRRVGLTAGSHTVGRDRAVDVTIDDASMSGRHLELRIAPQGAATIADVGSSNGTAVDGVGLPAGEPRALGSEEQVEAGRTLLAIRAWRSPDPTVLGARRDVMAFNRPPRVARPYQPPTLRVDAPPPPLRRARLPLLAASVPLVMGLSLFLITSSPFGRRLLSELWERRPGDDDFLDVRVGVADQPSIVQVAFGQGGDPDLRGLVEQVAALPRGARRARARAAGAGRCGRLGRRPRRRGVAGALDRRAARDAAQPARRRHRGGAVAAARAELGLAGLAAAHDEPGLAADPGLLLDPDLDLDGELLSVRLPRRSNAFLPPGRGYLVVSGVARLIQVAA